MHLFFSRTSHKISVSRVLETDLFFGEVIGKKKKYFEASYLFLIT
jgi:hypothetical protein